MIRTLTAAAAISLLAAAPAAAEWTIDNSHTHILFSVNHFGMSNIIGEWEVFEGALDLNADDPAASAVSITIDAASLDTGHEGRDAHFLSADFFEAETYPEITFVSTGIEMTSDTTMVINGDLTIKDTTQSVALDATFNGSLDDHPVIDGVQPLAGFSATTTVLRSDFGVDMFAPYVSDEVVITIEMEVVGPTS